jgi:hypothetical protein
MENMLIQVIYQDDKKGTVEAYKLDDLIKANKIKKFRRSGKWVTIGADPIREIRDNGWEPPRREKTRGKVKKGT